MPQSLVDLEQQRIAIFQEMQRLPDFRSGSITTTRGTCGKPNCRCHQPNQPGHGPNVRLTRKVEGKTITETFSTPAELHKYRLVCRAPDPRLSFDGNRRL